MFKNITFCLLMFCSCLSFAQETAELVLNVPCPSAITVAVGERICLDFQVSNFNNIVSAQFQTEWNPAVFDFDSVSVDEAISDAIDLNSSFIASTNPGKLKIGGWITTDFVNGSTLPDETILFTACFIAKAAGAANFRVGGMDNDPVFPIEIINVNLNSLVFLPVFCSDIEVTDNPVDPIVPVDTIGPVDPIGPIDPIGPVDSIGPVDPIGPIDTLETEMSDGVIVNIAGGIANVGEDFCVDVTVGGFTNMVGTQFRITWDTALLSFKEYTDFALPNATGSFSNTREDLRLLWVADDFVDGVTLADGENLFSICFTAQKEGTTSLIIDEVFPVEMIRAPGDNIETTFEIGEVTVNGQDCSFQIDLASTDISCADFSDGTINTITEGAAADFIYAWSTGESSSGINNLSAGIYSVTVTDLEGCMIFREVTIIEPDRLVIAAAEESTSSCFSDIVINAGGGVRPFQYRLNDEDSQPEPLFNNLVAGTYKVVVTDASGCTQSTDIIISEKEEVGTSCDDGDENTRNDVITEDCECKGKTEAELDCPAIESEVSRSICEGQSSEGYTESGTYTDTFQAVNGCDSVRVLSLMLVDRIVTEVDATICAGDTINGYSERGSYIDVFSSVDGCDSLRILSLFVFSESDANCLRTSTIDIDQDDAIQVAPNPVAHDLTIEISNSVYLPATVAIYGIHGNLVDRYIISSPQQTIPMGNKDNGMYVLILETPDAQFVKRIIKK